MKCCKRQWVLFRRRSTHLIKRSWCFSGIFSKVHRPSTSLLMCVQYMWRSQGAGYRFREPASQSKSSSLHDEDWCSIFLQCATTGRGTRMASQYRQVYVVSQPTQRQHEDLLYILKVERWSSTLVEDASCTSDHYLSCYESAGKVMFFCQGTTNSSPSSSKRSEARRWHNCRVCLQL